MKKLAFYFKQLPTSIKAAMVGFMVIALPAMVMAGFGPQRPVFDYNKDPVNGETCTQEDIGEYNRCGSLDGPVFNSFVNTPTYGDERNATRIAEWQPNTHPKDVEYSESAVAEPGKTYWVRTLIHNNANEIDNGENFDGEGVAKNTRFRVAVPEGQANGIDVMTYVTADNAQPQMVYDSATLANDEQAFSVDYVEGTAVLYNKHFGNNGPVYLDFTNNSPGSAEDENGVLVGWDEMNGVFPGCFDYAAYVYVQVKVEAPELETEKLVRPSGGDQWSNEITASQGDTIDWRINVKNTGGDVAEDVTIRDQLPEGLDIVPGSITWFDENHRGGETLQDTALSSGGVNIGNYAPAGTADFSAVIRFSTEITEIPEDCRFVNVGFARATNIVEVSDVAYVNVEPCEQVVPSYSCDLLDVKHLDGRTYRFTTSASAAGGATIKQYRYSFGDDTDVLLTDKAQVEHTYAEAGDYVANVTVEFDVNGQTETATSDACQKTINITEEEEKPEQPEKPAKLPDTGAGAVAGMFMATSAAGTALHRVIRRRR